MQEPNNAEFWIRSLEMLAHPEGGFYKEVFRSQLEVEVPQGKRAAATSIYYLLRSGEFSAFHRIKSDETWYYHAGDTMEILVIGADGKLSRNRVGIDPGNGSNPQFTVPANLWFAARPLGDYSLVGCSVAPGFDFKDFEMAEREVLLRAFPHLTEVINEFTRT